MANWSISTDKFMFQESNQPNKIFVLILVNEGSPKLYEITLPDDKAAEQELGSINFIQDFVTQTRSVNRDKSADYFEFFKGK